MSHRLFSDVVEAEIARRYNDGESSIALAVAYNTSDVNVRNALRRQGVVLRPAAHLMNPVVTNEQRAKIIKMCAASATLEAAAAAVGVSKETAWKTTHKAGLSLQVGHPRTCEIDDHAFDVLTPECLYWIGFLFADGCLHQDEYGSPALVVGLSAVDREHLKKLRTFLKSTHAITNSPPRNSKPIHKGGPDIKTGPSVYFRVRSKRIFAALSARGIVTKSARVPPPALARSRDFWRGAVDGDGTVCESNCREYVYPEIKLAGQRPLMMKYSQFLTENKCASLSPYWGERVWIVGTSGSTAKSMIRLLYEGASVFLDRKMATAKVILSTTRV